MTWYEGNNVNNDDVNTLRKFKISTNLSWNFKAMGFATPSTKEQDLWEYWMKMLFRVYSYAHLDYVHFFFPIYYKVFFFFCN